MGSIKYTVLLESVPVACHMELEKAIILVEAMFGKYFSEASVNELNITIRSEPFKAFGDDE